MAACTARCRGPHLLQGITFLVSSKCWSQMILLIVILYYETSKYRPCYTFQITLTDFAIWQLLLLSLNNLVYFENHVLWWSVIRMCKFNISSQKLIEAFIQANSPEHSTLRDTIRWQSLNRVMMMVMNMRVLDVVSQPPQMDMIIYTAVISVNYRHGGV